MARPTVKQAGLWLETDMKRLNHWFHEFMRLGRAEYGKAIRKTALDLTAKIMKSTPVDTGRARMAWSGMYKLERTTPPEKTARQTKGEKSLYVSSETGGKDLIIPHDMAEREGLFLAEAKDKTKERRIPHVLIINPVSYVPALEAGHSKQAPPGQMIRNNVRKVYKHFIKSIEKAAGKASNDSQKGV